MNPMDDSDAAILLFKNLQDIIEIFESCPVVLPGDRNKSENFTRSLDNSKNGPLIGDQQDRAE